MAFLTLVALTAGQPQPQGGAVVFLASAALGTLALGMIILNNLLSLIMHYICIGAGGLLFQSLQPRDPTVLGYNRGYNRGYKNTVLAVG